MYAQVFLCINQHTKFEVPSFIDSKNMIGGQNLKSSLSQTDPRDAVPHAHVLYTDVDGQCDKLVTDDRHQFITQTV